jgi:hypothetical protein
MAAGLAAYPAVQDIRLHWVAVGLGAAGLATLTAGLLVRSGHVLGWGLAALGAEYAVHFAAEGRVFDAVTPVYAAGLILVAELAFWSIESRVAAWSEPGLVERRLAYVAATAVGAAVVAALALVVAAASRGGGLVLEAAGVASAIAVVMLLAVLVRRSVPEVDSQA